MMKRFAALLLALLLVVPVCALGEGEQLTLAAPVDFAAQVENLPGYEEGYNTWSLTAHETLAMQEYIAVSGKSATTLAGFYFSLKGELDAALVIPQLHVFYKGTPALGMQSASFLAGGVRYDLVGSTHTVQLGGVQMEEMVVPLDENGLALWRSVCAGQQVTVQLYGQKAYAVQMQMNMAPKTVADYVGNASLNGAASLLKTLDSVFDMANYQLWDLNAAYCQAENGVDVNVAATDLAWATGVAPFSADEMGVMTVGDTGNGVTMLQDQLSARGFLVGPSGTKYSEQVLSAVKMAQVYYGLPVTGFADRALYECLVNCAVPAVEEEAALTGVEVKLGDVTLTLNRYWVAEAVEATHAESALGKRSINSADEALLVVDGQAVNNGLASVASAGTMTVNVEIGGMQYAAEVLFEKNGGALLQDSVEAGAQCRVLIVAYVPADSLDAPEMNLSLSVGDGVQTLSLVK